MLRTKYIVLDQFECVYEEQTGRTALFDKEEADAVAQWLREDGSKSVIVIPFKYTSYE